jgi:hypothetical protein
MYSWSLYAVEVNGQLQTLVCFTSSKQASSFHCQLFVCLRLDYHRIVCSELSYKKRFI